MAFWGAKLKPSKPQVISDAELDGRVLHVSQATLGLNAKEGERSIVKCKCADGPAIFICSLKAGVNESCSLDLNFDEDVIFSVSGSATVHLAGYMEEDEEDDYDNDYDDELDEDYRADPFIVDDDDDEEEDEVDDSDNSDEEGILTLPARPSSSTVKIEDITGEEKAEPKNAQGDEPEKAIEQQAAANGNEMKEDQGKEAEGSEKDQDSEDEDGFSVPAKRKSSGKEAETATKKKKTAADDSPATLSAKKKKKKGKKVAKQDEDDEMKDAGAEEPKQKQADKSPSKSSAKKAKKAAKKFPNGLEIHDMVMGKPDGKQAKRGKKVSIHYIGKLKSNGKIFDSTVGKKPFQFRLGVNEVVKGFDIGVSGMRIGDKRRVVIPPSMGYGNQSVGPIPPNSWLDFEIELVDVKG